MRVLFLTSFDPLKFRRPFLAKRAFGASHFYLKYYRGYAKEAPRWINILGNTSLGRLKIMGAYAHLKMIKSILSKRVNAIITLNPTHRGKIAERCRTICKKKVILDYMDVSLSHEMALPTKEAQIMSQADGVIFWSKVITSMITRKYRLRRFTYIPIGADLRFLDFNKANPRKFRRVYNLENKFLVVYSGGIWMVKGREVQGIFDLIKAYSHVARRMPNVAFVFNGFYPDEKISQVVKDLNLGTRILFLGPFRYGSERHLGAFAAADALVLPATYHPPIYYAERHKVFEYMAAGKAIIAVRTPGVEGVLNEKACIYAELGDVESIADGLIRALRDRDLREDLGNRAKEILKLNYTWGTLAPKYARFVWQVCQDKD